MNLLLIELSNPLKKVINNRPDTRNTTQNKMALNPKKTKEMWICFTDSIPEPPRIRIDDEEVERVKSFKLLGVSCQNDLKWNKHVDEITRKRLYHDYHIR